MLQTKKRNGICSKCGKEVVISYDYDDGKGDWLGHYQNTFYRSEDYIHPHDCFNKDSKEY